MCHHEINRLKWLIRNQCKITTHRLFKLHSQLKTIFEIKYMKVAVFLYTRAPIQIIHILCIYLNYEQLMCIEKHFSITFLQWFNILCQRLCCKTAQIHHRSLPNRSGRVDQVFLTAFSFENKKSVRTKNVYEVGSSLEHNVIAKQFCLRRGRPVCDIQWYLQRVFVIAVVYICTVYYIQLEQVIIINDIIDCQPLIHCIS